MRTYKLALAAAAAVASAGALVPATTAAADTAAGTATATTEVRDVSVQDRDCEETAEDFGNTGTVNMYDRRYCAGSAMCKDVDNDSNYGSGGACRGGDNNDTSSVVNLGWNTVNDDVLFYTGYYKVSGERTSLYCVKRGQSLSTLDGIDGNNKISSHRWINC
jgi:hypothetical protein